MTNDLKWTDLSGEKSRTYVFPGERLKFLDVARICVRPSGTHRLELRSGLKVIVSAGWLAIEVEAEAWTF